ncbi:MAG: YhgE/Pip domain-containing protein [Eubacterium sp.]|nr:YhgE/Pip domain-containing protein [Eubacterium sp.]
MQNIRKIFFRDVAALFKHPFALVIAGGLCILPALYAWFNIYSNWDPYGNTGNIRIAVASKDKGYKNADGSTANVADTVIDTLKENESIAWTVVETEKAAVDGVYDGSYYAAVVFSEDFTQCMYEGFLNGMKRPAVTYYENEKKNAVATKITDTAVSTLETNINEQYISLVVSLLFEKQRDVVQNMEAAGITEEIIAKIQRTKDAAGRFASVVKSVVQANDKLTAALDGANSDLSAIDSSLEQVQSQLSDVPDMQALADRLNAANARAVQSVSDSLAQLKQAQETAVAAQKNAYYERFAAGISSAKGSLDQLIDSIQSLNAATVNLSKGIVLTQLENQSQALGEMQQRLSSRPETEDTGMLAQMEQQLEQQVKVVQQVLQTTVSQSLALLGNELQQASAEMSQVLGNVRQDTVLLGQILESGTTAISMANQGFSGMSEDFYEISNKLEQMTELINGISEAQLAQKVLNFVQGNAQGYGAFFAEPVTMETEAIYPVDNYGSGVAPFYTTLALWVGGVVLVSMIKVKAHTDGIEEPKAYELFLGRYLLFFVLALIQAAITVWGNFYLLHIQCLYPRRFLLAAFVTSFTFSLLIYALTISFGDVGKAMIVVIMVLQIAGSSGTYPIEILPQFYQKLYIFFPFPYAINAMREAIAGIYEHDYSLYLLRLLLFAAAALALGLVIRLPFCKFFQFVERRMEDTEMM